MPPKDLLASGGIAALVPAASEAGVTRITLLPSQLDFILRSLSAAVVMRSGIESTAAIASTNACAAPVNGSSSFGNSHLAGENLQRDAKEQLEQNAQEFEPLGIVWPDLRLVVVSGEPLWHALVYHFRLHTPRCTLVNLYGSTEVAGDIAYR